MSKAAWGDDPRTGESWFSHHGSNAPRGYWRKGEPRFGVTKDDPPRYRKHSLEELQDLGYARRDISYEEALAPLFTATEWNIREAGEMGGRAQLRYEQPVTPHTILGRKREAKQYGYYMQREDIANDLRAAGLTEDQLEDVLQSWDQEQDVRLEVQETARGRVYSVFDGTGAPIGREFTEVELQRIAMEGTEMEGEFLEYLAQRQQQEAAASAYIAELYNQGIDPYELGHSWDAMVEDLDQVKRSIEDAQMYATLDDGPGELAQLEEDIARGGEPYTVDLDELF